jgi:predicted PurR-regulated permease PerM
MQVQPLRTDLPRSTLAVVLVAVLIGGSIWVLRPFLPATVWSTLIVVSTWPLMQSLQTRLWGRRTLAVAVMLVAMIVILVLPVLILVSAIHGNADLIQQWFAKIAAFAVPPVPASIERLPFVGPKLAAKWQEIATAGPEGLTERLSPYLAPTANWMVHRIGGIVGTAVHLLLTLTISAIMYLYGETAAKGIIAFSRRLAPYYGEPAVRLAASSIRALALGIIVTAVAQSVLTGIGLAIAGVPQPVLLAALAFVLCIAQIGPLLVLVPAVIWLFYSNDTGWAIFLLIWSVGVGSLDNVLRPWLIKRGADLPLLLIFAGVIGGLVAFGIVGLFIGPVVLAVTYTLADAWVKEELKPASEQAVPGADRPAA